MFYIKITELLLP